MIYSTALVHEHDNIEQNSSMKFVSTILNETKILRNEKVYTLFFKFYCIFNWKFKIIKKSHSVTSYSLQAHELQSPLHSPGQNTRVGSFSFLQGIFPTQGSNPGLLHCRWILYQLSPQGSPKINKSFCVYFYLFLGFCDSSVDKESACNAGDPGLIPGSGGSGGEGIGYPLQCSWAALVAQLVKNLPAMQETWV